MLRRNDEFGGTFIADEIVQDWSGRLGEGFVVVVEKTCSAGGGGGIVVMVEGRMGWSFWGDRDFETMGGGRGSFGTRDWVMRGSWDIHLGSRSLWWRVEAGELYILSASRKPTDRNHFEDGRIAQGLLGEGCTGFIESGIVARRVLPLMGVVGAI